MALAAIEPSRPEPDWSGVLTVDDLAAWAMVSSATIYAAVKAGDYDFARIPAGRAIRFSGPALAARFGIPGYASEGRGEQGRDLREAPGPRR